MFYDANKMVFEVKLDADRLERIAKQNAAAPEPLVVKDEALVRLLARAGAGGSY